jgi:hypothetical protein
MLIKESSEDNISQLFKLDMSTQEKVMKVLDTYSEDSLSLLQSELGISMIPEDDSTIPIRHGVCYDYIWALTGETWYLIENLYNPKISLTGKFAVYPGVSLLSFCKNEQLCKEVYDYLASTDLVKYYKLADPLSYHIQIHTVGTKLMFGSSYEQFIGKIGHGIVDWNLNRWNGSSDCLVANAREIYFRETMGLHYEFTPDTLNYARFSRMGCNQKFGIPDDKIPFHLTIGHKYNPEMPPPDLTKVIGKKVSEIIGKNLELSLPLFYQFESVDEYEIINK